MKRPPQVTHSITVRIDDDGTPSMSRKAVYGIADMIQCSHVAILRALVTEIVRLQDPTPRVFRIRVRKGTNDGRVHAGKSSAWLNAT